jgi:hypothetical protein
MADTIGRLGKKREAKTRGVPRPGSSPTLWFPDPCAVDAGRSVEARQGLELAGGLPAGGRGTRFAKLGSCSRRRPFTDHVMTMLHSISSSREVHLQLYVHVEVRTELPHLPPVPA